MSVQVIQTCDRCSESRGLSGTGKAESLGWRQIPVDQKFGDERPEQPWLCAPCVRAVYEFIQQGVNVDASPS